MSEPKTPTFIEDLREVKGLVSVMWTDLYGDKDRHERGLVQDFRGITSAINRLTIVLVFFAMISMLNLMAVIWVVLSL